jgi:hypothetical protein
MEIPDTDCIAGSKYVCLRASFLLFCSVLEGLYVTHSSFDDRRRYGISETNQIYGDKRFAWLIDSICSMEMYVAPRWNYLAS